MSDHEDSDRGEPIGPSAVDLRDDRGWTWQPDGRSVHIVDYPAGGSALVVVAPIPDMGSPIANDFIRKTTDAIAETLDRMIVAEAIAATNADAAIETVGHGPAGVRFEPGVTTAIYPCECGREFPSNVARGLHIRDEMPKPDPAVNREWDPKDPVGYGSDSSPDARKVIGGWYRCSCGQAFDDYLERSEHARTAGHRLNHAAPPERS